MCHTYEFSWFSCWWERFTRIAPFTLPTPFLQCPRNLLFWSSGLLSDIWCATKRQRSGRITPPKSCWVDRVTSEKETGTVPRPWYKCQTNRTAQKCLMGVQKAVSGFWGESRETCKGLAKGGGGGGRRGAKPHEETLRRVNCQSVGVTVIRRDLTNGLSGIISFAAASYSLLEWPSNRTVQKKTAEHRKLLETMWAIKPPREAKDKGQGTKTFIVRNVSSVHFQQGSLCHHSCGAMPWVQTGSCTCCCATQMRSSAGSTRPLMRRSFCPFLVVGFSFMERFMHFWSSPLLSSPLKFIRITKLQQLLRFLSALVASFSFMERSQIFAISVLSPFSLLAFWAPGMERGVLQRNN